MNLTILRELRLTCVLGLCFMRIDAMAFEPAPCNICSINNYSYIPFVFDTLEELPWKPDEFCRSPDCPHYINNLDYSFRFWANANVGEVVYKFTRFDTTHAAADYLSCSPFGPSGGFRLGGNLNGITPFWRKYTAPASPQQVPFEFRFITNNTTTRTGFRIEQVGICCNPASASSVPMVDVALNHREAGVLLQTGDVVYFRTPTVPSGSGLNAQALSVVLRGVAGNGPADFDLYARCGALPEENLYDFRSISGDLDEFVRFPNPGSCPHPNFWYFAVVSYFGRGQFALYVQPQYQARAIAIRVGLKYSPLPEFIPKHIEAFAMASRQFYGMTEGLFLINRVDIYPGAGSFCENCGGAPCDVCVSQVPGSSSCCIDGQISISGSHRYDPEVIAHEYGHRWLDVPDEYSGNWVYGCGHSVMAFAFGSNNNLCNDWNHGRDHHPSVGPKSPPSVWTRLKTYPEPTIPVPLSDYTTRDNYDFIEHDFDDKIEVVFR